MYTQKKLDGVASNRSLFAPKDLKAKNIEMELANVYGDEALQISIATPWRTRLLQETAELGYDPGSGRPTNSDLPPMISELIRERPFLSSKISCRHLGVSKATSFRLRRETLGLKKIHLQWVPHQFASSPQTEHENLKSCHVTSTS
jgi:hypothetical protein